MLFTYLRILYFKRWSSFVSYRTQFNFAKKPKPLKPPRTRQDESRTTMTYLFALAVATAGAAYAAVPLYRVFCQQTGYGGTTQVGVSKLRLRYRNGLYLLYLLILYLRYSPTL